MKNRMAVCTALGVIFLCTCLIPMMVSAEDLPFYLKDRGTGIPTSMFGTYVRKEEVLVYPFYEYYYDYQRCLARIFP